MEKPKSVYLQIDDIVAITYQVKMRERLCKIYKILGQPTVDLLASWILHHVQAYISWRRNPFFEAVDILQHLNTYIPLHVPTICRNQGGAIINVEDSFTMISISLTWQPQPPPYYPWLQKMTIRNPIHLPNRNPTF